MSTLMQVASIAGVSKATVSRVVNQRGNVHPDTIRAVKVAMDRAKYEPPALKPGRTMGKEFALEPVGALAAYGLVVPQIAGGLYVALLAGFEAAANERDRQSIVSNTRNNVYRQSHEFLQLIHKRVSGVAIVPVAEVATPASHILALESAGIPVVLLHRDVEGVNCPLIALPLEEVGYTAGSAILQQGHRRVAMLTVGKGPSSLPHIRGLRRALQERQLRLPEEMILNCASLASFSISEAEASVASAMERLLEMPADRRPTAVYATNDTIAELIYLYLMGRGLRCPEEFSVVGFGAQERLGAILNRLTSVVVDERMVGQLAVEFLERVTEQGINASHEQRLVQNVDISISSGTTLGVCKPARR